MTTQNANAVAGTTAKASNVEAEHNSNAGNLVNQAPLDAVSDEYTYSTNSTLSTFDASPETHQRDSFSTNSTYSTVAAENWGELVPVGDGLPDLPIDSLPSWAAAHAKECSEFAKVPTGLFVLQNLASLATCVQGKFDITPGNGREGYVEPSLSIWTWSLANVGGNKTGVVKLSRAPIVEWEIAKKKDLQQKKNDHDRERRIIDNSIKRLEETAAKATNNEDRAAAVLEIKNLELQKPSEIICPEVWLTNITDEALQSNLAAQKGCTAILADEGGVFDVMAGMYSGSVNADTFLAGHAGGPIKVIRQGRSCDVPCPAITIGLVVQPGILQEVATESSKKKLFKKGLYARFLYFYPAPYVGGRNVRDVKAMDDSVLTEYSRKVKGLLDLPLDTNEEGQRVSCRLTLSSQAFEEWLTFWEYIESNQGEGGVYEHITDWTSKLHGACLRIAGLIHVGENGKTSRIVEEESMRKSIKLCKALIPHATKAYDLMLGRTEVKYKVSAVNRDAQKVLEWVLKHNQKFFRKTALVSDNGFKNWKNERLEPALIVLQKSGHLSKVRVDSTTKKPTFYYDVRPEILVQEIA